MKNPNQASTFNVDDPQEVLTGWPRLFNERICQIVESPESGGRVMMHINGGYVDLETALERRLISDASQFRPERAFFEVEDIVATMGGRMYDKAYGIIMLDPEESGQMLGANIYFGNHTIAMSGSINGSIPNRVNRQFEDGKWANTVLSDQDGWEIVTSLGSIANQLADRSRAGYQRAGGNRDNVYQLSEYRARHQSADRDVGRVALQKAA